MIRKSTFTFLVILLLFSFAFISCTQKSLSGKYVATDNDELDFEFTASIAKFSGMAGSYEIENGYVHIVIEYYPIKLKIVNANTLEVDDAGAFEWWDLREGQRFIKK